MLIQPQKQLAHYSIIDEIGVGGLGRVYKAVDLKTGKTVAIKILHDKFSTSKRFLGIFHRELLIISRLHHKNIVSYLDGNFDPPICYIVTEFVDGYSIYGLLKLVKKVPPLVAMCIGMEILQGIDYLHLHDNIHADLSAPNVLINKIGRVLVTDFGLAFEQEIENYKNYMVGTPGYYSPEHITEIAICPQTDIYCIGLILYELIVGQKAVIAHDNRKLILRNMKHINFKQIICSDKKMQKNIQTILYKALQFNISRRYQSAEEMMFDIYLLLKKYNIRYGRHAIFKFLWEYNLTPYKFEGKDQEIYQGFIT